MTVALVIIVVTLVFAVAIYAFAYSRGLRNQREVPLEKRSPTGELWWIVRGIRGADPRRSSSGAARDEGAALQVQAPDE